MTTIAANHQIMVSDRLVSDDSTKKRSRKIFRVDDALIGIAGTVSSGTHFCYWYAHYRTAKKPVDFDGDFTALVLNDSGLWLYENGFIPEKVSSPYFVGTGAGYAEAAHMSGKSLEESVRIASRIDLFSGYGIQVMRL